MKRKDLKLGRDMGILVLCWGAIAQSVAGWQQVGWAIAQSTVAMTPNLIERGKQLYEGGKFSEAAEVWEEAAKKYQGLGDRLSSALSLNYLSLVYQELGEWDKAQKAIASSLTLLEYDETKAASERITSKSQERAAILGEALNTRGSLMLELGQSEAALETWQQAEKAYAIAGDTTGVLGTQLNQAQALQSLGMYRRANDLLERANAQIQAIPDSWLKMYSLHSLGSVLQAIGSGEQARQVLESSFAIATHLKSAPDTSAILLSLGNTAREQGETEAALKYYQRAAVTANGSIAGVQARLNELSLKVEGKAGEEAIAALPEIQRQLANLPASRSSAFARVNLAQTLMKYEVVRKKDENSQLSPLTVEISQLLAEAVRQAQNLRDERSEAFALSQLGKLYEINGQWKDAKDLTVRSLAIANNIGASDIAAKAFWQLGRVQERLGERTAAIAAYKNAVNALQALRNDITAINPDIQFNFRDTVEPVYREFVSLLLQSSPNQKAVSQENLKQARKTIEGLQLAELDNFFRDACLAVENRNLEEIDPKAAVIYPIVLSDRLEVILSIPGQPLRHYTTYQGAEKVEDSIASVIESINPVFSITEQQSQSEQVYNWLIRPAEADLKVSGIETLVFVPDGSFRNLPMAVLYDGKQYLVEKYRIALSPGLQLLSARSLAPREELLSGGLTQSRKGFPPLPAVEREVEQIAQEVKSKVLLDSDFTRSEIEDAMEKSTFEVVHLATHGQFSSKFEETFLLTWDGVLNVKDLEQLLINRAERTTHPLELLVLSACKTAAGDRRAALGLAGFALRSGASSTLATLWSVQDESTAKFMTLFYRSLAKPNITKAEAVRQAQQALINSSEYKHPFFWAPFVLVGNWL